MESVGCFLKCCCLDPTPRDSDTMGLEWGPSIGFCFLGSWVDVTMQGELGKAQVPIEYFSFNCKIYYYCFGIFLKEQLKGEQAK